MNLPSKPDSAITIPDDSNSEYKEQISSSLGRDASSSGYVIVEPPPVHVFEPEQTEKTRLLNNKIPDSHPPISPGPYSLKYKMRTAQDKVCHVIHVFVGFLFLYEILLAVLYCCSGCSLLLL